MFRQHMVVKGENRDTAWYSIIDKEWPALKRAYEAWLDPAISTDEGTKSAGWKRSRARQAPELALKGRMGCTTIMTTARIRA